MTDQETTAALKLANERIEIAKDLLRVTFKLVGSDLLFINEAIEVLSTLKDDKSKMQALALKGIKYDIETLRKGIALI